ncbi:MAG: lasso peptide biosynthesis B2 protein [Rubrivivax sp.]|nr:lasso peptide biosynthesis B2 protein [Rubrivivax sp.]
MHSAINGPSPRLCLAGHVRACRVGGQVILLDLLHGRYIGVGGEAAQRLGDAIDGWPEGDLAGVAPARGADVARLIGPLRAQRLLTHHTCEPRPVIDIEEPARSLDVDDAMAATRTGVRDLRRFLQAAGVAGLWLRWRSMHGIASAVAARRPRPDHAVDGNAVQRLHGAMTTYEKLRPLVFTARDRCLFDSLALMNFLAGERLFPSWVIGVKTGPFRAHSWVQSGDLVLNDQHENVRRFKPILVV